MRHAERCAVFAKNLNTLLDEKGWAKCRNPILADKFNQFMAKHYREEMFRIDGSLIAVWRNGGGLPCLENFAFLTKWLDCEPTDLLAIF